MRAQRLGAMEGAVAPLWKRFSASSSASRKERGGNYVQLATVGVDGRPKVRTVVFRGLHEANEAHRALKMITHAASNKVKELAANPAAEMVYWFSKTSEQYRLAGRVQVIGGAETDPVFVNLRKQTWGQLSDPAREQFFWPDPGQVVPPECADFKEMGPGVPSGGRSEAGALLPAPDTFLVLLLWPDAVHYLRLKDNLALRDSWSEKDKSWTTKRVVP